MNKKTFKFAGLALGLSMAVAGVGVVVGHALHLSDRVVTHADEPETQVWDMTVASYDSASQSQVWWRSSGVNMRLRQADNGGYWPANIALGGGNKGNGNKYQYTEMYTYMTLEIYPGLFQQINTVSVTLKENSDVAGWTGGTKSNCSVSASGTTITVTPTDKTKMCSVYFSDFTRVTGVAVNHAEALENLDSVTVDTSECLTTFLKGNPFMPSRLAITARDDQGHSLVLKYDDPMDYESIDGLSITGADTSSTGEKTVTVSLTYKGVTKSDTFTISVIGLARYSIEEFAKDTLTNPDAINGITASYSSTNPENAIEIPAEYSHTFTLTPSNNNSIYLRSLEFHVPSHGNDCTYKAAYSYGGETNYLIGSEGEAELLSLNSFNPYVSLPFNLLIEEPLTITVSCAASYMYVTQYNVFYEDGPKTYLDQVSSATNLWDGQQIVFSDGTSKIAGAWTSGNNIATGAPSFTDGDICLQDSEGAAVYTVGRVNIDDTIYYTFFDGSRYLRGSGSEGNNYLTAVETLDDYCYFAVTITDGTAIIRSKVNEDTPYLGFQSDEDIFSCFGSGQVNPKIYAATDYSAAAVANSFEENRLLLSSYISEEGYCKDNEHGYYAKAKVVWQAMSDDERSAVSSDGMDRLVAWAAANGDILDENMDLVSKANQIIRHENGLGSMDGNVSLILVLSSVVIAVGGGIFFVSRRRREEK